MEQNKKKQGMDDVFVLATGNDNEAQIRRVLEDFEKASINHYNFKKYTEKWLNTRQIVLAQIENEYSQYVEELETYRELKDQERVKNAIANRVVPLDIYDAVLKMHFRARQIVSWKFIEAEMSTILMYKLSAALGEVRAVDIEREVVNRMHEMEENRNKLFLEIMTTRFDAMDTKFVASLKVLQETHKLDKKENTQILANALITNSQIMQETIASFAKTLKQTEKTSFEFDFDGANKPLSDVLRTEKSNIIHRMNELRQKAEPKDVVESVKQYEADLTSKDKKDKLLSLQDPKKLQSNDISDDEVTG
jgi:hypothetical protein